MQSETCSCAAISRPQLEICTPQLPRSQNHILALLGLILFLFLTSSCHLVLQSTARLPSVRAKQVKLLTSHFIWSQTPTNCDFNICRIYQIVQRLVSNWVQVVRLTVNHMTCTSLQAKIVYFIFFLSIH